MAITDESIRELANHWFEGYQRLLTRVLRLQDFSISESRLQSLSLSIMYLIEGQALIWRHLTPGRRQRKLAQRALMEDISVLIESRCAEKGL